MATGITLVLTGCGKTSPVMKMLLKNGIWMNLGTPKLTMPELLVTVFLECSNPFGDG